MSEESNLVGGMHTFNTSARYSAHGQRIAWSMTKAGRVQFVDADRNIGGILDFDRSVGEINNGDVLRAYRSDNYEYASEYKGDGALLRAFAEENAPSLLSV